MNHLADTSVSLDLRLAVSNAALAHANAQVEYLRCVAQSNPWTNLSIDAHQEMVRLHDALVEACKVCATAL
jgi:hypothetical protein